MESLALKYRPRRFEDLAGQKAVQVILRPMVAQGRVPSALLFNGGSGTGKTTTARIVAAALNCDTPPGPCGTCPSCKAVYDGTSMDVLEIDAASHGLVEDIRALRQQVLYHAGGTWRVVILDEAHSCSPAAFNALLKTLEEPPPQVLFTLCTTEAHRIPETVATRCMPFTFGRVPHADILARLRHVATTEGLPVAAELLALIAERAEGGMRHALMSLDQISRAGITTLEAYTALLGEPDATVELLSHLSAGDTGAALNLLDEVLADTGEPAAVVKSLLGVCRDLMSLHAGGTLPRTGAALAARQALAQRLAAGTVLRILRVLWDLPARTRIGIDTHSALQLAVAMIGEILTPTQSTPTPPAAPPAPLSLARMAALAQR